MPLQRHTRMQLQRHTRMQLHTHTHMLHACTHTHMHMLHAMHTHTHARCHARTRTRTRAATHQGVDYGKWLLAELRTVGVADALHALKKYIVPLFDASANVALTCPSNKLDAAAEGLEAALGVPVRASPHISPYLPISPPISPYLPISPHISKAALRVPVRMLQQD